MAAAVRSARSGPCRIGDFDALQVVGIAFSVRKAAGDPGRTQMLYWALVFLVVALIAGAVGFGGIAGASAGIAQILFFIFIVLLCVSVVAGFMRRAN